MKINLTPDQESFIRIQLEGGSYRFAEEVLEIALRLLDEYGRSEAEWVEEVWAKVDVAIEASKHIAPVDGETFVNGILERFQQEKQP